jgi:hypothetical protein
MKFECGDLDRALAVAELMPEAREHLKICAACRKEYRVWNEISATAKSLHEEWATPALWTKIKASIEAEPRAKEKPRWIQDWRTWTIAATVLVAIGLLSAMPLWKARLSTSALDTSASALRSTEGGTSGDFLTDQALREVERTETAYRQSIERLSRLAQPKIEHPVSDVAMNCKERLQMLDSAITDVRTNLTHNRFNVHLQTELADLYREKQQTLQELLSRDQKN